VRAAQFVISTYHEGFTSGLENFLGYVTKEHLKLEVYPGLNPGRCAVAIRLVKAWKLGVALEYLDGSWVKENMCCYT
jgi:hypothetical protein